VLVTNHQIMVVLVSLVLMVALTLFIQRTRTGKAMRAVAFNRDAASLMGIPWIASSRSPSPSARPWPPRRVPGRAHQSKIEPLMGIMPGIKAFVAAVLGGIGSIPGAMIGGLLMGSRNTWSLDTSHPHTGTRSLS